ncbi:MAG: dihydropteroate synthase [Acidimicrobiia bacterium]|nr:dihydropteroate synthase [Acidimicrobiia bacterium]
MAGVGRPGPATRPCTAVGERHQRLRRSLTVPHRGAPTARRWSRPTSAWHRGCPIPSRTTTTWWRRSIDFLADRQVHAAEAAGRPAAAVADGADAGLDLGKTEPQSLELLRASDRLAGLGYPVFLSASNKRFLWELLGVDRDHCREGTLAAHALGVSLGCRVLRAHDVRGTRRVADTIAAILEAA